MKILSERFLDEKQAGEFWDNAIFDMLDISFYLTDCGLLAFGKEFCDMFLDKPFMSVVVNYKFNFELVKKFLGVPNVYVDRKTKFGQQSDVVRDKTVCSKDEKLKQKYLDVISVLYRELDIAKKEILNIG